MTHLRWTILLGLSGLVGISCSDDEPGTSGAGSGGKGSGGKGAQGGVVAGRGGSPGAAAASGQGGGGGSIAGSGGSAQGGTSQAGSGADTTQAGAAGDGTGEGGNGDSGAAGTPGSGGAGGFDGVGGEGGAETNTSCVFPAAAGIAKAQVPAGFCAWEWATGVVSPRGITVDSAGNALVVSSKSTPQSIVALWDANGDGVSGSTERATIASVSGLTHGIALHAGFLYASSADTVYRWAYTANRTALGTPTSVITGIPSGGHSTRTLAFDAQYLYVSVGSSANVDPNSDRARIRRFPVSGLGATPLAFSTAEVFADGLRNEVGLRFDSQGRLWGVENGRDNLNRADLGGDIHTDNPGEELNLFAEAGRFYGYPYCFTEFLLPTGVGLGNGTQWADPSFMNDGTHTDAWCRNTANVVPPILTMQAHSAPLDILFYQGTAFPAEYVGDAFVTFHGSWNRTVATGYKVMHIPFGTNGMPNGAPTPLLEYSGPGDDATEWVYRPVGLATLPNGVLLVTSDASNTVLAVGHQP